MRGTTSLGWRAAGLALGLVIGGFAGVASALPPEERPWDLGIGLYGWVTATDLEAQAHLAGNNFTTHFDKDKSVSDAFEDWDGGGGGYLDGRYRRFVGLVDGAWAQTDLNGNGWFTNTIIDLKVGYRVLDVNRPWSSSAEAAGPRFKLDLLAGARYRDAEVDIRGNNLRGNSQESDWWDPVVGLRMSVGLIPNLTFDTVADIGGFDLGSASHLTWSVNPRLNYRAWDHLDIFVGWKHLYDERNSHLNGTLTGPQVGLGYSF